MSSILFTKTELAAAVARGVRQCVMIGARPWLDLIRVSPSPELQIFSLDEEAPVADFPATFVSTEFGSETLSEALAHSNFDHLKSSLFVWLGGAGYRTADAVIAALGFIASLPLGSGVVFDYSGEREPSVRAALDSLASHLQTEDGRIRSLIDPQAVAALLRSLGFRKVVDLLQDDKSSSHLVCAVV